MSDARTRLVHKSTALHVHVTQGVWVMDTLADRHQHQHQHQQQHQQQQQHHQVEHSVHPGV
jgi:hypothetical protein